MPLLFTRLIKYVWEGIPAHSSVTGVFLYPAYASYKSLASRPVAAQDGALERWLQYWAIVGAWTAVEGAVGWMLTW